MATGGWWVMVGSVCRRIDVFEAVPVCRTIVCMAPRTGGIKGVHFNAHHTHHINRCTLSQAYSHLSDTHAFRLTDGSFDARAAFAVFYQDTLCARVFWQWLNIQTRVFSRHISLRMFWSSVCLWQVIADTNISAIASQVESMSSSSALSTNPETPVTEPEWVLRLSTKHTPLFTGKNCLSSTT